MTYSETEIKVLDHGYIKLVEHWGSDERIIEAARMSTDKGFQGWGDSEHVWQCPNVGEALNKACPDCNRAPGDEKLLKYLWTHNHATPFEMAGAIFEVKAPLFVIREWHRHRTWSYNELSARYTPMPDENYVPTLERCMLNSTTNKQAGRAAGADELTEAAAADWLDVLRSRYEQAELLYQGGLKMGIPKELARLVVPVARYSRMRAQANLRNLLAFLTLRMDNAAQWEIRQYAFAMHQILTGLFPRTLALFDEGRK